jgi:mevalonate kinase
MTIESRKYYSHGKLLLSGEYLVMFGAKSLAVPVNFGQEMVVETVSSPTLTWEAFIEDKLWLTAEINLSELSFLSSSDEKRTIFLLEVLKAAKKLNPYFLNDGNGFNVTTKLNYPQQWGLGSSSTFISNVAQWAGVDAMQLNSLVSEGSGYDIACTQANNPILYQLKNKTPYWHEVSFVPTFSNHLYFLFLGKKQDTFSSIINFKKDYKFNDQEIGFVSNITMKLLAAATIQETMELLDLHESFVSRLLNVEPVKRKFFSDFNGTVKSLGAWGGDFAMVASEMDFEQVKKYFDAKGFNTLFRFDEMILDTTAEHIAQGGRIISGISVHKRKAL